MEFRGMKTWGTSSRVAAAIAIAALVSAAPAAADTLRYDGAWFGSFHSSYTLRDSNPSALSVGASSGAFRMTDVSGPTLAAGTSFMAWCVDIYHRLSTGSAGDSYNLRTAEQFYGTGSSTITRLQQLASYVVGNDGNPSTNTLQTALTGSLQSAAFQLAVWEIVNEATTTLNVNSGDFYVTGGSSTVRTLANTWLTSSAGAAITQTMSVWEGGNSTQDLAVFAPIPEAETYAMLLAGLGLMGFVARRRRRNLAAA